MAKFQYFGPPFSIQLSDRTLQLRPGSVVQLDESGVDVVSEYDGVRLVPVPEPKMVIVSPIEPEPVSETVGGLMTTDIEGVILGSSDGSEEPRSEVKEPEQDEPDRKKKKKKKKERKKDAPNPDSEG